MSDTLLTNLIDQSKKMRITICWSIFDKVLTNSLKRDFITGVTIREEREVEADGVGEPICDTLSELHENENYARRHVECRLLEIYELPTSPCPSLFPSLVCRWNYYSSRIVR